jgi:hypothetical protein
VNIVFSWPMAFFVVGVIALVTMTTPISLARTD